MVFWIPSLLHPRKRSGEGFWFRFSVVDFILRMVWKKRERELKGEIMRTDVFVQVFSKTREEGLMEEDLDRAFRMFRDFESRFSRFREGNELSDLNRSSVCHVSFAIDIENAFRKDESAGLLLLSGQAVATSGVNRRRWQSDGQEKSHLIDVEKGGSVSGDILTVTVVDPSPVRADIMAKTLCILGRKKGMLLAQRNHLPALFLLKDGTMEVNEFMKPYVWEDDTFFL